MFCKYCGKIIDDDSRFCRFCGEDISSSNSLLYSTEKTHIANKSIRNDKRLIEKWNKATNYIKPKFVWIWKVIKTIGLIIVGITAWTIIGVFYAPFIALFNAEIPDLGIFEDIQKIWRKD